MSTVHLYPPNNGFMSPLEKFRRAASIVRMFASVCLALRRYTMEGFDIESIRVGERLAIQRGEADGNAFSEISFNTLDFKTNYEFTWPRFAKRAIEKKPCDRTEKDIEVICRLMRGLVSFRKYTPPMQKLLSKIIRYTKFGRRRVVVRKGHRGESLYFIFSGSVSVVLDKDEESVFVKQEVITLTKGSCFGEIALIEGRNATRQATVVCSSEAEFLVVDKYDFDTNGLKEHSVSEQNFRLDVFREHALLKKWSEENLYKLSRVSRNEEFVHGRVVVEDSRKNAFLWMVTQGVCNVLRVVNLSNCTKYQQLFLAKDNAQDILFSQTGDPLLTKKLSKTEIDRLKRQLSGEVVTSLALEESMMKRQIAKTSSGRADFQRKSSLDTKWISESEMLTDDEVPVGIFMRIDAIRPGDVFGLENLYVRGPNPKYALVSGGCKVIQIPKSLFIQFANEKIIKTLLLEKEYQNDNELCQMYLKQNQWAGFKNIVLEETIADQKMANRPFEDSLRRHKRIEFTPTRVFDRRKAILRPQSCMPRMMAKGASDTMHMRSGKPRLIKSAKPSTRSNKQLQAIETEYDDEHEVIESSEPLQLRKDSAESLTQVSSQVKSKPRVHITSSKENMGNTNPPQISIIKKTKRNVHEKPTPVEGTTVANIERPEKVKSCLSRPGSRTGTSNVQRSGQVNIQMAKQNFRTGTSNTEGSLRSQQHDRIQRPVSSTAERVSIGRMSESASRSITPSPKGNQGQVTKPGSGPNTQTAARSKNRKERPMPVSRNNVDYKVERSNLFARTSKCTVQLVKMIQTPSYQEKMKRLVLQ
ncbi:unnamed protein product [Owenia fusiformis]|uniref:Cyclic nucleotide-binding domain-containing protein 2 n=1 Tax=Owenia fusiformis TaxID=6347 RepID=A0A8S4N0N6_OWEFU|nr:unnamed protein product [Owenia fusiformis]